MFFIVKAIKFKLCVGRSETKSHRVAHAVSVSFVAQPAHGDHGGGRRDHLQPSPHVRYVPPARAHNSQLNEDDLVISGSALWTLLLSLSYHHVLVAEFATFACKTVIMTKATSDRLPAICEAVDLAGTTTVIENVFVVLKTRE